MQSSICATELKMVGAIAEIDCTVSWARTLRPIHPRKLGFDLEYIELAPMKIEPYQRAVSRQIPYETWQSLI